MLQDSLGTQGGGIAPDGIRIEEDATLAARIEAEPASGHSCGRCGEGTRVAYDRQPLRGIRDFPVWGRPCCLEVSRPAIVRVALRANISPPPDWLASWTPEAGEIRATDGKRVLYAREFPAGPVTLGANRDEDMPTGKNMYSVVVVPSPQTQASKWMLYE